MGVDLTVVPRTGGASEDAIIQQLLTQAAASTDPGAALYEDDEFSPSNNALYLDPQRRPEYAASSSSDSVAWYRPTEYTEDADYFKSPSGCGVLREGVLPDAWLLGVFAAVALHPDNLIENLFVSDSLHGFKQHGVYACRFYKNGQWVTVTTDTRVPYTVELEHDDERGSADTPGHVLYGGSLQKNEVFVPLLEKAYAKLHGCYQALDAGSGNVSGRILEALLDCTGGSAVRVDVAEETRRSGEAALWKRLVKYKKRKCVVTAQLKQLSFNAYDLTPSGLVKNRQYVVMHVKEVATASGQSTSEPAASAATTTTLRFVKLKNVWGRGMWKGEWSNDDTKWEEFLQVELALRNDPACNFSRSGSDGCFWMVWEDFVESFNELYVAHVFGDGHHQYCVAGEWAGFAAGGAPALTRPSTAVATHHHAHAEEEGERRSPLLARERPIDRTRWAVLSDADPNWHRNPQFRLTVAQRTSGVLLSLLQRDFRLFGGDNYAINVVVLAQKASKPASIVWEFTPRKVVAEAHSYEASSFLGGGAPPPPSTAGGGAATKQLPEREIVKEELVLEPDTAYYVVPYTDHARVEMEFFLRVFAPRPVVVERVESVFTATQQGKWRNEDSGDSGGGGDASAAATTTAGGPLCVQLHGGEENAAWCQNPQFWLRVKPMAPTKRAALLAARSFATLKITVRKTSTKAAAGGGGKSRSKEQAKDKANLVGVTVLRGKDALAVGEDKESSSTSDRKAATASVLRAQAKAPKTNFLGEIIEKPQWKRGHKASDNNGDGHDDEHGGGEEEEAQAKETAQFPTPRLVVNPEEWCRVSDYSSAHVACMYLRKVPKQWLLAEHGGLMVVPTLGEAGAEGSFDVQVDCDLPVAVDELPRLSTQSVPGEWDGATAAGCHLHGEWKKNPKLFLFLKGVRPAKVKITLTRSELEWKTKCKRDAVGTMMGFYLFHGQRLIRAGEGANPSANQPPYHAIIVNGRPWSETDFVPLHSVASPPELVLPSAFNEPYVIMPATYEPGKTGRFVVSVQCDTEFTLTNEEP